MPNSEAIKLVGNGDGKIDAVLHKSLGNEPATPFQTRFGIKERRAGLDEKNDINKTWQLGKGTFAPRDLSQIGNGYDLVISSEQLKGRGGVREREREGGRERSGGAGQWGRGGIVLILLHNFLTCREIITPTLPLLHSPTPPLL